MLIMVEFLQFRHIMCTPMHYNRKKHECLRTFMKKRIPLFFCKKLGDIRDS